MIEFKNISKIYQVGQQEVKALDNISFSINKGKFTVILDAGHGGQDIGATRSYSELGKLNEKDITLPEMGEEEQAMLFEAFHVKPNSRLGCQIPITPEINGLEVVLAPFS